MSKVVRFGISLEEDLAKSFDRIVKTRNYPNRSKAISDLVRQELIKREWETGREVAGAITLIYDHHKRELVNRLTQLQHDFQKLIISAQHVHLDHDHCLEIIAVKGKTKEVLKLSDMLKSEKGVKHGTLSMSTTGRDLG